MQNPELIALAKTFDDWIAPAPGIPAVYLFGSCVRGDHRPDSDVDVRLFFDQWRAVDETTTRWWLEQNESDFAALKALLPGPLSIHREQSDQVDASIRQGMAIPVLVVGRVLCVWTPPRVRP